MKMLENLSITAARKLLDAKEVSPEELFSYYKIAPTE